MSTLDNLLSSDGCKFTAKIQNTYTEGEVLVHERAVFLLQNTSSGSTPGKEFHRGYKYSWAVGEGTDTGLYNNSVKEFNLVESNLLRCEGKAFSAKIDSTPVTGIIHVEDNNVYLLQNIKQGSNCRDKKGFSCSWSIRKGSARDIAAEDVTEFRLTDSTTKHTGNLLLADGKLYSAKISGEFVEGIVRVQDGEVYLLQNLKEGSCCRDTGSFKFSWTIGIGDSEGMADSSVTEFRFVDKITSATKFKPNQLIQHQSSGAYYIVVKILASGSVEAWDKDFCSALLPQHTLDQYKPVQTYGFTPINLRVGTHLIVNKISSYCDRLCKNKSLGNIPLGSMITVTQCTLHNDDWISFAATYNSREYGFSLSTSNSYSRADVPCPTKPLPPKRKFKVGDIVDVKHPGATCAHGGVFTDKMRDCEVTDVYSYRDGDYSVSIRLDAHTNWEVNENEIEFSKKDSGPIDPNLKSWFGSLGELLEEGPKRSVIKESPRPTEKPEIQFKKLKKFEI